MRPLVRAVFVRGYADNILYAANEEQKERYLIPTIEGERISCFAITEPGAGSDARSIRTSARRDGGDYVISGEKTFITRGNEADFVMAFAVVPDQDHLLPRRPGHGLEV